MNSGEAMKVVEDLAAMYPRWLSTIPPDEIVRTLTLWADEIQDAGDRSTPEEVWASVKLVCRHEATPFVPGLFELSKTIRDDQTKRLVKAETDQKLRENSEGGQATNITERFDILRKVVAGEMTQEEADAEMARLG